MDDRSSQNSSGETPATVQPAPAQPALPPASAWWENLKLLAIALALALAIRTYIAEPRFIPSNSMVPTLRIDDRLVVEKVSYRLHAPKFGDIIVFHPPDFLLNQGFKYDQAFIKRIIGLPGQKVEVKDHRVYIDDHPLDEPYINEAPKYGMSAITIPTDSFFVMGDNRNNSNDSHVWGFLPRKNIIGHAWLRFFPFNRLRRFE
jgi:signal peptidase I